MNPTQNTASVITLPLLLFALWVPLPLASNRPVLWFVNMIVLAMLCCATIWVDRPARRIWSFNWALLLSAVLGGWVLVSVIPGLAPIFDLVGPLTPTAATISVAPSDTLHSAVQMLSLGLTFVLANRIGSGGRTKSMLLAVLVIIVAHAVYGIALASLDDPLVWLKTVNAYQDSATGGFVNRNSFATFLGLGLVVAGTMIYDQVLILLRRNWQQFSSITFMISVSCFVVIIAALLASQSRMGLFSAISGVATVVVLHSVAKRKLKVGALAFAILMVTTLTVVWFFGIGLLERAINTDLDTGIRLSIFKQSWAIFTERPIFGFGGGSFITAFGHFKADPLLFGHLWSKSHNTYLALLAELGVVGFALMMALFLWMIVTLGRKLAGGAHVAGTLGLSCLVVIGVHSLADFSMEIYAVAFFLMLILGICSSAPIGTDSNPRKRH